MLLRADLSIRDYDEPSQPDLEIGLVPDLATEINRRTGDEWLAPTPDGAVGVHRLRLQCSGSSWGRGFERLAIAAFCRLKAVDYLRSFGLNPGIDLVPIMEVLSDLVGLGYHVLDLLILVRHAQHSERFAGEAGEEESKDQWSQGTY